MFDMAKHRVGSGRVLAMENHSLRAVWRRVSHWASYESHCCLSQTCTV
jgi:muconolactone delta-isomerase